jgi:hypothetical protein
MHKLITLISVATLIVLLVWSCQNSIDPDEMSQADQTETGMLAKASTFMSKDTVVEYWYLSGECLEEMLHIYYEDELMIHTTIDNKGGYHAVMRWRPINTVAYGEDSGGEWRPVGAIPIIEHSGKIGQKYIFTQAGCYNWKAQQKGPSLIEPWTIHLVVNADGEVIVNREHYRFICKPDK